MTMTPIVSSNLAEVGYNPKTQTLYVQFHSGAIWEYYNVDEQTLEALLSASSIGSYFHYNVKLVNAGGPSSGYYVEDTSTIGNRFGSMSKFT